MAMRTRRDVLQLLGVACTSAVASGCCTVQYGTPQLPRAAPAPLSAPLQLGPVVKSRLAPTPCIDVHGHFFNASDVPVKDYIGKCFRHDLSRAGQAIMRALGGLANELARIAPTAQKELDYLGRSVALTEAALEDAAQEDLDHVGGQLEELFEGTRFAREYAELKADEQPGVTGAGELSKANIIATVESNRRPGAESELTTHSIRTPYPDGFVAFTVLMCLRRSSTLTLYRHAYSRNPNAFGIDNVVGALVDFDYWLDCPPLSSHEDQIEVQLALSRKWNGYMRPLVGYNPMTDIREDYAGLRRVKDALRHKEFVGVKIYPPNGFRPDGPEEPLRGTLKTFFDYCAEHDLPVMAHSAQSRGRTKKDNDNGGPDGWEALLARYAGERKVPIVNVGHLGGNPPPDETNDWTARFANLMSKPYGARLYGDLGFWEELLECGTGDQAKCEAALTRLTDAANANGGLARDRIMFGTDWLMLSTVDRWAEYPHRLARALNGHLPFDKFFGANALKCFPGLAASAAGNPGDR